MVVSAVERFAQVIPLNIQEIFLWYFEQKGVDNPERFLGAGVNSTGAGVNIQSEGLNPNQNPENQLSQNLPQDLPQQNEAQQDMSAILSLLKLVYKYASENGEKSSELEKLIDSLETMTEAE